MSASGDKEVIVANPRKDTVSREVYRHSEFDGYVELTRIRDFFLCEFVLIHSRAALISISMFQVSIESTGSYAPQDLFPESIKVMREKIATLKAAAESLRATPDDVMEEG
jgi:DNA-directed RNA polymerase I and III subunit RPAC1